MTNWRHSKTDSSINSNPVINYVIMIRRFCKIAKKKSVPLQAWSGPEDSRKLRFPDFMTTAQGGGKVVSLTHWPHLPSGNSPDTHFLLEVVSTPGP